jgi:hypothetical protein
MTSANSNSGIATSAGTFLDALSLPITARALQLHDGNGPWRVRPDPSRDKVNPAWVRSQPTTVTDVGSVRRSVWQVTTTARDVMATRPAQDDSKAKQPPECTHRHKCRVEKNWRLETDKLSVHLFLVKMYKMNAQWENSVQSLLSYPKPMYEYRCGVIL